MRARRKRQSLCVSLALRPLTRGILLAALLGMITLELVRDFRDVETGGVAQAAVAVEEISATTVEEANSPLMMMTSSPSHPIVTTKSPSAIASTSSNAMSSTTSPTIESPPHDTVTPPPLRKWIDDLRSDRYTCRLEEVWRPMYTHLEKSVERLKHAIPMHSPEYKMVLDPYWFPLVRYAVINGTLYAGVPRKNVGTRVVSVNSMMQDVVNWGGLAPEMNDTVFCVIVGDDGDPSAQRGLPHAVPDKLVSMRENSGAISAPEFSFHSMLEVYDDKNETQLEDHIYQASVALPFRDRREERLTWYGRGGGVPRAFRRSVMLNISHALQRYNKSNINPLHAVSFVDITETCKSKYLLHSDGLGAKYSNRLKWLLMCGGLVFIPRLPYEEYYYFLLVPNVTHVEIPSDDAVEAARVVLYWMNEVDEETKERVALNGQRFAYTYASSAGAWCFWRRFLTLYSLHSEPRGRYRYAGNGTFELSESAMRNATNITIEEEKFILETVLKGMIPIDEELRRTNFTTLGYYTGKRRRPYH